MIFQNNAKLEWFETARMRPITVSYIFVFYVALISYIIYVAIFAQSPIYINVLFIVVLNFHVCILSTLIFYCGSIVLRNVKLSNNFTSMAIRLKMYQARLSLVQMVKVSQVLAGLSLQYFCISQTIMIFFKFISRSMWNLYC